MNTLIANTEFGTCAAVITYYPDIDLLREVVENIQPQIEKLIIFDNGTIDAHFDSYLLELDSTAIHVIRSLSNVGIATAINQASTFAKKNKFIHLLLLDQDSVPYPDMVHTLRTSLDELSRHEEIAAVGPQFVDSRTGHVAPFIRIGFPFSKKIIGGPAQDIKCDFLISSGTLLKLSSLAKVGPMDEGLFIDNVDLEWCFRARHKGMALYGICDAKMRHSIGDDVRLLNLVKGGVKIHSPIRLYYITRNRIILYSRKETPCIWILQDVPRLILKFLGTSIFLTPRASYFSHMIAGFWDALLKKRGPMPPRQ